MSAATSVGLPIKRGILVQQSGLYICFGAQDNWIAFLFA